MQAHMEVEVEDEGARRGVTGGSDDEGDAGKDKLGEKLKRDTAEVSTAVDVMHKVKKGGALFEVVAPGASRAVGQSCSPAWNQGKDVIACCSFRSKQGNACQQGKNRHAK
eukprot:1158877-Pelagomonas_calceolata.AAC.4